MGRAKDKNSRRSRAERRKAERGVTTDTSPGPHILELRRIFSFVQPPPKERLDGRNGEIDSEICDDIGKLCALGLLDGHDHDPIEMRDKGRFWGCHYAKLMKVVGVKCGAYERASKGEPNMSLTAADLLFDRMDENLQQFERNVLLSLVVDPLIGHEETVPWAKALIDEALLARGKIPKFMAFPTEYDRELLAATIRGLVVLIDGSLPQRWASERCAA